MDVGPVRHVIRESEGVVGCSFMPRIDGNSVAHHALWTRFGIRSVPEAHADVLKPVGV